MATWIGAGAVEGGDAGGDADAGVEVVRERRGRRVEVDAGQQAPGRARSHIGPDMARQSRPQAWRIMKLMACGRDLLGGDDEVALVLAVLVVDQDDHPPGPQLRRGPRRWCRTRRQSVCGHRAAPVEMDRCRCYHSGRDHATARHLTCFDAVPENSSTLPRTLALRRPSWHPRRVGLWLIGAFGGVGTTAALGLASPRPRADRRRPAWSPPCRVFDGLDLDAPADVRRRRPRHPPAALPRAVRGLQRALQRLHRPADRGVLAGPARVERATSGPGRCSTPNDTIRGPGRPAGRAAGPLAAAGRSTASRPTCGPSRRSTSSTRSSSSTSPRPSRRSSWPTSTSRLETLDAALDRRDAAGPAGQQRSTPTRRSTLGLPYVNFTPSLGTSCPALDELARRRGVPHGGKDGKTGETLLKTVLAPMFAARQPAGAELGRAQHLRQPRRPGARTTRTNKASKVRDQGRGPRRDPRLQAADARVDRVHRVARRLEDGLGPHPLRRASSARR